MSPQEVINLLHFLDQLFQLGGKLVEAAIQKSPKLNLDPLPDLFEMENARKEALSKLGK